MSRGVTYSGGCCTTVRRGACRDRDENELETCCFCELCLFTLFFWTALIGEPISLPITITDHPGRQRSISLTLRTPGQHTGMGDYSLSVGVRRA